MSVDLILVRHGNTFGPGDKVVWCGARTDLPLVEKGRAQADAFAKTLQGAGIKPARILAGPLLRTRQHADILASAVSPGRAPDIAETLREIDYGLWEGLSTDEITALGGGDELTAWDTDTTWPEAPGWSPPKHDILRGLDALLAEIAEANAAAPTLIVTSNGILRFVAGRAENAPPSDALKVRTGHYCQMRFEGETWKVLNWNVSPETPLF